MVEALAVKFGGSVFKEDGFKRAAEYLARNFESGKRPVAVVSAAYGVSDKLIQYWSWPPGEQNASHPARYLRAEYEKFLEQMPEGPARARTSSELERRLENLEQLLLKGDKTQEVRVLAAGEDHAGVMLRGWIEELGFESRYFDGAEAGVVVYPSGNPKVETTKLNIRNRVGELIGPRSRVMPVVGGYAGFCDELGQYLLMGRNTTDVTLSLVASAFDGAEGEIVKEVPGVLFVEPEIMQTAQLGFLNYGEAAQTTRRGAKVVHPLAIEIARENEKELVVKDMGEGEGTRIGKKSQTTQQRILAAASVGPVYVYTVRDAIMATGEGRGYAAKDLGVFDENGIPTLDVLTGANRVTVTSKHGDDFDKVLKNRLREMGYNPKTIKREKTSITLTGDAMSEAPGSLHRITGIVASQGVTIRGISQPDEEDVEGVKDSPSVTLIVDSDKVQPLVRALYDELGPVATSS